MLNYIKSSHKDIYSRKITSYRPRMIEQINLLFVLNMTYIMHTILKLTLTCFYRWQRIPDHRYYLVN